MGGGASSIPLVGAKAEFVVRNVRLSALLSSLVVRDSLPLVYILASHADVWRGVWGAGREGGGREILFKKEMM